MEPSAAAQRMKDVITQRLKDRFDVSTAQRTFMFHRRGQFVVRYRSLLLKPYKLPRDALPHHVVECSNFKLYFHIV